MPLHRQDLGGSPSESREKAATTRSWLKMTQLTASRFGMTRYRSEELHALYWDSRTAIQGPARATQNISGQCCRRVHQLSTIPQSATVSTTQHLLMLCQATFNVLRKPVMDDAEVKVHQSAISNEYARIAHAHARSDGFFSDKKEMVRTFVDDALNYHKYESIQYWQWEGHYALLASQIIGAWTALDALTSDLWVALVNERPPVCFTTCKRRRFKLSTFSKLENTAWLVTLATCFGSGFVLKTSL